MECGRSESPLASLLFIYYNADNLMKSLLLTLKIDQKANINLLKEGGVEEGEYGVALRG